MKKELYKVIYNELEKGVYTIVVAVPSFSVWSLIKYIFTRTITLDQTITFSANTNKTNSK
jgi:hypothetical protein